MKKKSHTIKEKIIQVEDIISDDLKKRYTPQQLAKMVNMDVDTLHAQFRKENGRSIRSFQSEARILAGRILIAFTEKSIRSIANEVGFSSSSSFSQQFKKIVGVAPGVFRKKTKEEEKALNASPNKKRRYLSNPRP